MYIKVFLFQGKYCLVTKYNISKYINAFGMFEGDSSALVKLQTSTNHIGHYQYIATLSKTDT